jgi:hypothetical protein
MVYSTSEPTLFSHAISYKPYALIFSFVLSAMGYRP